MRGLCWDDTDLRRHDRIWSDAVAQSGALAFTVGFAFSDTYIYATAGTDCSPDTC
jgi:hypothetical protein